MSNVDDTILLNEEDYGDIKSNLEEMANLLMETYNDLNIHLNNIEDMNSKFINKKLEDDIQIILSNLKEINEYSESLLDNYTSYYESMLEVDEMSK